MSSRAKASPTHQSRPGTASAGYAHQLEALAVASAAGIPVLLWGGPGEGKSSVLNALAAARGWHLEVVIASLREPADFAGLPIPDASRGRVRLAPPDWACRLTETSAAPAVFFDEISCAPPATQAALLRVVCDRVVGDLELPAETVVLAAANPADVAADGWELPAPMANRFCHLDWRLPAEVVADGLLGGFPEPPELQLPESWEPQLVQARALISAYLRVRPGDVSVLPRDAAEAGRAFPTPRTWTYAARLLAVCEAVGADPDVQRQLVAGVVGDAAALQLLTYLAELDLPDPELVLARPDRFQLPDRDDRAYAALASVVAAVLADCSPTRWEAGVKAVAQAAAQGRPDVGAAPMTALLKHRPKRGQAEVPVPSEVVAFAPVLRRAGLLGVAR